MIHEDERRVLESYPEAKLITANKNTTLGGHYHKIKTEKFILIQGNGNITRNGLTEVMSKGFIYEVTPGTMHSFFLLEGSVIVGLNSHPYNPSDDYKE